MDSILEHLYNEEMNLICESYTAPKGFTRYQNYYPQKNEIFGMRYQMMHFLGYGGYGKVISCLDKISGRIVVLKILRDNEHETQLGLKEIAILKKLKDRSATSLMVEIENCFFHNRHLCIVFEPLAKDLRHFQKRIGSVPMHIPWLGIIAKQILSALQILGEMNIIHTDIKPENIMLVNPHYQPLRIKIIDFGSSITVDQAQPNDLLQTLHYRSPEIILGLPYDTAIDIWSLGCVLTELLLGWCIFSGCTEYDQIRCITDTLGLPHPQTLHSGFKTKQYFNWMGWSEGWILKTPEQIYQETRMLTGDYRRYPIENLDCILEIPAKFGTPIVTFANDEPTEFVDLLKKMLRMDRRDRISVDVALRHPFIEKCPLYYDFSPELQ